MAFEIFGYKITKNKREKDQPFIATPVTPSNNDGSTIVSVGNSGLMSGYYQYNFDVDGTVRSDAQMISQYRATASYPDVDTAIEAIVNEAVIVDQSNPPVSINLDNLPDDYSAIKDAIQDSFQHILNVLEFNDNCHDIFKRWYIDGKLYYFVIIDPKDPKKGIIDLKYIDPRKIRKVIEYVKENRDGVDVIVDQRQYYVFNDNGLTNAQGGIKISTDSIINVRSGLIDANSGEVVSYLFKAIKPTNQLKMMEDSLVIYRITRAPERRVFYVDVGNLPGQKAEQYVRNIMNKFRNRVVYDAATGEVKNNRNLLNMCLAMDTKVSLLDGRALSIREIADELAQGKQLWTTSCHPKTGETALGKIDWAGVTRKSAKVLKITLNNGQSVTCTYDHRFPIKNVGFVLAENLNVGDQLISTNQQQITIKSIEALKNPIEVGCLTIDKYHTIHDYHTFALVVGCYTGNCEDFWLPRREGGKATEIQTLPSAGNLSQIEDIQYFQGKLYQAMNVPRQRLMPDNLMSIGNNNEITREEVAFSKFIQRLRNRFNVLFKEALRIQLIATKTIRQSDWEAIRNSIFFEYQHDNYFEELKRIDIFNQRMTQLQTADGFKGVYFSKQYIARNVLDMSEELWNDIQQQIKQEQIDEAIAAADLERKTTEYQAQSSGSDDDQEQSADDSGDDNGYDSFVDGDEGSADEGDDVEQSGDTTDTIDDTAEPNPGEDNFERPAATGLTVAGQ